MGAALDVEMLAHLAAFRVKASVIHADRLLADKFQRLYDMASVADLDAAVGAQVHGIQCFASVCLISNLNVHSRP